MTHHCLHKYITGNTTPEESRQVAEWVKADAKNMEELTALRRLYDVLVWQDSANPALGTAEWKQKRLGRVFAWAASAVAVVALLIAGGGLWVSYVKRQMPAIVMQTMRVPAGQRAELILADETSVWLNAGSTLTFPNIFPDDGRRVILDGEAYFDVRPDEGKPFIVETPSYDVRVLGTEFNVLAYRKSPLFEVSLLRGGVEVYAGDAPPVRLEPQTKVYQANHRLVKERITHYDYLLWKDGLICFDDESIDAMISKLELYYDVRILVQSETFKRERYTGKFRTKDGIDHILKVFQLKEKFTYDKDDEKNLILIHD
ncbi:MAG: FecR domain-containing protein [Tannerellaceae bacterium]|jgi:ferric-dicitrate binding protein FerR (iron transport regulator)|nr:FecR domain-containing protein [Tannerellaceae bacterium]